MLSIGLKRITIKNNNDLNHYNYVLIIIMENISSNMYVYVM